jgi:pimeloyl-ACP methyl ester carboxylesterase
MTGTRAVVEPITGRYLRLEIHGVPQRIYVEESGQGTALVCLHTAGADSRQYRGLLNDPDVTAKFRVICFDLPWHGKSSPPPGWHETEYQLTTSDYVGAILAVIDALELDRPVVMGCSIGGRVVLHLALEHPELLGGVIGLQAGAHVDPYYDTGWLHRSDVPGAEVCAAVVSGLIAPTAPSSERWETLWHYSQGGPGVFKGDLHFYMLEGDIRDRVARIDTDKCPVFLLSGEYDYSCTPEDTQEVAGLVKGSYAEVMPELGHFPMSENYERFRSHLIPVLDLAVERRAATGEVAGDAAVVR